VLHWSVNTEQSIRPPPVQTPARQASPTLQNSPSLHPVPFGSAALHASAASLHEVAQLASVVLTGHGFPACVVHAPVTHVSGPLQKSPSLHAVPFKVVHVPGLVPLQV
jgi:hypothetical protein